MMGRDGLGIGTESPKWVERVRPDLQWKARPRGNEGKPPVYINILRQLSFVSVTSGAVGFVARLAEELLGIAGFHEVGQGDVGMGLHILFDDLPPYPLAYAPGAFLADLGGDGALAEVIFFDHMAGGVKDLAVDEALPDEVLVGAGAAHLARAIGYQHAVGDAGQHVLGEVERLAVGHHVGQHSFVVEVGGVDAGADAIHEQAGGHDVVGVVLAQQVIVYARAITGALAEVEVEAHDDERVGHEQVGVEAGDDGLYTRRGEVGVVVFDVAEGLVELGGEVAEVAKDALGFLQQGVDVGVGEAVVDFVDEGGVVGIFVAAEDEVAHDGLPAEQVDELLLGRQVDEGILKRLEGDVDLAVAGIGGKDAGFFVVAARTRPGEKGDSCNDKDVFHG